MFDALTKLLFPDRCIGCERSGSSLCALCERTITLRPQFHGGGIATLFEYHHPLIKKGIRKLKYEHERGIGAYFGVAIYREFFKDLLLDPSHERETIYIIPIPLSPRRRLARTYNHAAIIAQTVHRYALTDNLPIHIDLATLAKRTTKRQVETESKAERAKNLSNAFHINGGKHLRGHTIVLIDDVVTTGSTFAAAKAALEPLGPRRILGIAVAH